MSIWRDSAAMVVWRGVALAAGALTAVLLGRWLGPEGRGDLAVVVLTVSLITTTMQLGVPEALIYLTGLGHEREGGVSTAAAMAAVSSVLAAAATWWWLDGRQVSSLLMVAGVIGAAASLATTYARHVLLGGQQFRWYGVSVVVEVVWYLLVLSGLRAAGGLTVGSALTAYASSLGCAAVVAWWAVRVTRPDATSWGPPQLRVAREALVRGRHLLVAGLGGFGVQRLNFFVLEQFAGLRAVGLYTAASTLPNLWATVPQQVATVLYSHASGRTAAGDASRTATVTVAQLVAVLGLTVAVPALLWGDPLVHLVFGAEFEGAGPALGVLAIATALGGVSTVLYNVLAGEGQHRTGSVMTVLSLVVLGGLAWWWVPRYGLLGAAAAQVGAALVGLLYIAAVYARHAAVPYWTLLVPMGRRGPVA